MQAEKEGTPPKQPAGSAALTGHAAAAHAAPVAFYGSHRVFLGAAPAGDGCPTEPLLEYRSDCCTDYRVLFDLCCVSEP